MNYISTTSYLIIGLKQVSEKDAEDLYPIGYKYWIRARGIMRIRANEYDIIFESGADLLYSNDYIINKTLQSIPMQKPEIKSSGMLMLRVNPKAIDGILPYEQKLWLDITKKDAHIVDPGDTTQEQQDFEESLNYEDPREEL